MKLGLDFQKAQKIFLIFCKIDTDESGSVDVDEAFEYMGGARTRFTERIFDIEGKVDAKQGFNHNFSVSDIVLAVYHHVDVPHINRPSFWGIRSCLVELLLFHS